MASRGLGWYNIVHCAIANRLTTVASVPSIKAELFVKVFSDMVLILFYSIRSVSNHVPRILCTDCFDLSRDR